MKIEVSQEELSTILFHLSMGSSNFLQKSFNEKNEALKRGYSLTSKSAGDLYDKLSEIWKEKEDKVNV